MNRTDISMQVIHFTKGDTWDQACDRLEKILGEGMLLGGTDLRKGSVPSVCMSEAPLSSLPEGLKSYRGYSRYDPFGVMFEKTWVFAQGGRPVIYESDTEFDALPKDLRWRHVIYDPTGDKPIDFTWEREWRIPGTELRFGPDNATVVVPSLEWLDRLVADYDRTWDRWIEDHALTIGRDIAEQYRENFPWKVESLDVSNRST